MVAATVIDVVAPAAGMLMVDSVWFDIRVGCPLSAPELMVYDRRTVSVGE
jgi:hypothetical protein